MKNLAAAVSVLALTFAACSTSPTGRKQLTAVSDGEMNTMGTQAFDELKKNTPIETDAKINAYVKCIALPITRVAVDDTGVKNWEIVVFKDKTANAFALPGGKIGVHTGILPMAKSPSQLAAVLGHEVGHVIARHGNERVSEGMASQLILAGASLVLGQDNPKTPYLMAALGAGAQYGVLLPHSRGHESEADLIGLQLMAKAGFDPRESVQLWRNMAAAGGSAPPEFLSTHPSNETRIKNLQAHIPAHVGAYEAAVRAGTAPNCGTL